MAKSIKGTQTEKNLFISVYKRNESIFTNSRNCTFCCMASRYYYINYKRNITRTD